MSDTLIERLTKVERLLEELHDDVVKLGQRVDALDESLDHTDARRESSPSEEGGEGSAGEAVHPDDESLGERVSALESAVGSVTELVERVEEIEDRVDSLEGTVGG